MCLRIEEGYKPRRSDIRYKMVNKTNRGNYSPVFGIYHTYMIGRKERCKGQSSLDHTELGFHVFKSKATAKDVLRHLKLRYNFSYKDCVIVKCRVEGFLAGGKWNETIRPITETWEYITILEEVK